MTGGTVVTIQAESGGFIAACFGENSAATLVTTPLESAEMTITHMDFSVGSSGRTVVLPSSDGFLLLLYLADTCHSDLWPNRPPSAKRDYCKGSICLISLSNEASICIHSAFHALAFHVPSRLLEELCLEAGEVPVVDLLTCRAVKDAVIWNLSTALLPIFDAPMTMPSVLLQQVGLALSAHIAHRYGCLPGGEGVVLSSALRHKRAKDFMIANFERVVDVSDIAAVSGISANDLTDDFAGTGAGALHWLMQYRVESSKTYLKETGMALAEVSQRCGFACEQAFVEGFTKVVGVAPAIWRIRARH